MTSCVDCTAPLPFYSIVDNICVNMCPDNTVANYKYSTNLMCQLSCPSECSQCDNLNGCLACYPNHYLYNNTCIKLCTIDMVEANNPSCFLQSTSCSPSISILDKPSYFLVDGTNLNLLLDVIDCGLATTIKWSSSLDQSVLNIQKGGKSLFVDSADITLPLTQYFDVVLYDQTGTNILSQDSTEIDFVFNSINGGDVVPFYLNSTITFSVDVFDQVIKPRLSGTVSYVWTCPTWVPFTSCNPRINKPKITVDGGMIDASNFGGDLTYDVTVNILVNRILYTTMQGFVVVYSQLSPTNFFSFYVQNYTELTYNSPMKFEIKFFNQIDRDIILNDVYINWGINRTDVQLMNGNNLPTFIVSPDTNGSGGYNITCTVTYRKGTRVETSIMNSTSVYVTPPELKGIFTVNPLGGIFTTKFRLTVTGVAIDSNAALDGSFVNTYQYFYLNPSNQYSRIAYLPDLFSDYTPKIIPPTNSLKARVFYDGDSYYELTQSVSILPSSNFDYITNINDIFVYDTSGALLELEAYALNFKIVQYSDQINMPVIIAQFNQKLIDILTTAKQNTILSKTVNDNIPRIGNIIEGYTSQMTSLTDFTPYITLFNTVFDYAKYYGNYATFSSPESVNFILAANNLISIYQKNSSINPGILDLLSIMNNMFAYSVNNIDLSFERYFKFNNIEVVGTTVNTLYLKNDITYNFNSNSQDNSSSGEISRLDLYTSNSATQKSLRNLQGSGSDVTVDVNSTILNSQTLDGTVQAFYFSSMYNYYYTNLQNSSSRVAVVPGLIQVSFLNNTRYQVVTIYNTTSNNNITTSNTNVTSVQEYVSLKFNNESLLVINFTLPYTLNPDYINKTTCILIDTQANSPDAQEAICNTWFDFTNNIIQCECDQMGMYTVVYNPNFKYLRKNIQFLQLSDTINQPWGYSTLLTLTFVFLIAVFWAYRKDKKQFIQTSNSTGSNEYSQGIREKLRKENFVLRKMKFGKLFCDLYRYSNDYSLLKSYKDTYFLRAHRMLVYLLRIYILIMFSFYVQFVKLNPIIEAQVEQRNILLKPIKNTLFTFGGDWIQLILNSLYYGLPVGIVMVIFPKLADWLFKYDQPELRFQENNKVVTTIGTILYDKLKGKCNSKFGTGSRQNKFGLAEDNKEANRDDLTSIEELKTIIDQRRLKAYINYQKMISIVLHDVRYKLHTIDKKSNLPEDLAPLYNEKVKAQTENAENRSYLVKKKLFKDVDHQMDDGRMGVIRDKKRQMKKINFFQQGKEFNQEELISKCKII